MEAVSNDQLRVELLDPVADRARLGTRFCWGGYIWQIRDASSGAPLLAGPEWPEAEPDPFNGQGLPEVLRHTELKTGRPLTHDGANGIIPGVGIAKWENGHPVLVEPARWAVTRETAAMHYCAGQRGGDWGVEVQRSIELRERRVTSRTQISNTGGRSLPLHWFAHPFFPLDARGMVEMELPESIGMAENPGFVLEGRVLRSRRRFVGLDDGHFEKLIPRDRVPFEARIRHPDTEWMSFSSSLAPDQLYVWANGNTVSLEPYLTTELAPGDSRSWRVAYEFGPAS